MSVVVADDDADAIRRVLDRLDAHTRRLDPRLHHRRPQRDEQISLQPIRVELTSHQPDLAAVAHEPEVLDRVQRPRGDPNVHRLARALEASARAGDEMVQNCARNGDAALLVGLLARRAGIDQDDAWRLEASGWKKESGTAITSDPAVHRFYASLIERGTAAGWLHLLFLRVGDTRIATSYGATFDGRLMLFKTGYDPDYATCSPFKLLTYFALQDAYAKGLVELDFLGDAEPWKMEWTSTVRGHDWMFVFARNGRARVEDAR